MRCGRSATFRPALLQLALVIGAGAGGPQALAAAQGSTNGDRSIADMYGAAADRLIHAALADSFAYQRLATLTDKFGHRFSGSESR